MKVPPKRKGNDVGDWRGDSYHLPSMKVPPKRKGNAGLAAVAYGYTKPLNESPSEKEGKSKN